MLQTSLESGALTAMWTALLLPNSEPGKRSAVLRVTVATGPNSKLVKLTKGIHWAAVSFLSDHTTLRVWVGGKGTDLTTQVFQFQRTKSHFWHIWTNEYHLPSLMPASFLWNDTRRHKKAFFVSTSAHSCKILVTLNIPDTSRKAVFLLVLMCDEVLRLSFH